MDTARTAEPVQCCDAIEQLREKGFEEPFTLGWQFNFGKETAAVIELQGINLFHVTDTGRVTRKGAKWIALNYCPFCGKRLREENDEHESEEQRWQRRH